MPRLQRAGIPDAGDEGSVGAAALLDALRDWFAEEFTAFLVEGEEEVSAADHFHGWVVAVLCSIVQLVPGTVTCSQRFFKKAMASSY